MAAIKSVVQSSGAVAEYWRIRGVHLDYACDSGIIEIEGYVNAEARKAKCTPLTGTQQVMVNGVAKATAEISGDLRTAIYPLVVEQVPFLRGAVSDEA